MTGAPGDVTRPGRPDPGGITVEEGIGLYLERYGVDPRSAALRHLIIAMGDLSDVEEVRVITQTSPDPITGIPHL